MKKKLVAFAVTAAMVVTSAVPVLAWVPVTNDGDTMPASNEVVIDKDHLSKGIENPGAAVNDGDKYSITVDFNRTSGKFAFVINTNLGDATLKAPVWTDQNNTVWINGQSTGYTPEGITTLTWEFDTKAPDGNTLETPKAYLLIDELRTKADPVELVTDLPKGVTNVTSVEFVGDSINGIVDVTGGDQAVIYQKEAPVYVTDVEVAKAVPGKANDTWTVDKDRYGRAKVVEQPVLGGQYIINSITLNDGTVIYHDGDTADEPGTLDQDIAKYVSYKWEAVNGKGIVVASGENDEWTVPDTAAGCKVTLTVSAKDTSGIFGSAVWGDDANNLAIQQRVAGKDRYETALKVADEMKTADGFNNFVVATGTDFADSMSATAFAAAIDAPILLVNSDTGAYEDEVATYIEENSAEYRVKVYVIGGAEAVSDEFVSELVRYSVDVERLAGANRYDTNLAVLKEYDKVTNADNSHAGMRTVLVATGKTYADALSGSATGYPVLLVGDRLTKDQREFLREDLVGLDENGNPKWYTVENYYVLGGTTAVNGNIMNELEGKSYIHNADNVKRLGGADRFATNRSIVNQFFKGDNYNYVMVATANTFADALTGGVLAVEEKAPIVLVNDTHYTIAKNIVNRIDPNWGFVVIGGENAVSNELVQKIA